MKRKKGFLVAIIGMSILGSFTWNLTARGAYESAEYKVIESDGKIEIREYPDLMLVSTKTKFDSQGNDGSFMRLFRYISGNNDSEQKIAMTTPVFMEGQGQASTGTMGFVMPRDVAAAGVPDPKASDVEIRQRSGGKFAVIRFSGRMQSKLAAKQEKILRAWMKERGLKGEATAEAAGYDPPFTPGFMRRNEVLIRIQDETPTTTTSETQPATS
ncbi:MAG: heme-binding protein [Rubripirellula sp.]|nr:heme-binding protein [Rubripirellula sp.]